MSIDDIMDGRSGGRPATDAPQRSRRRRGFRLLTRSTLIGLVAGVLVLPSAVGSGWLAQAGGEAFTGSLASGFTVPEPPQRSRLLAADGTVLATFFDQDRNSVELSDIAPVLRNAVLATEDAQFYSHGAADWGGIVRALGANAAAGEVVQGASTITQQYVQQARVLQADSAAQARTVAEASIGQKLLELGYAREVEDRFSKDEILQRYLNLIYFGQGAYGVEVAAHRYFSVSADELTLPQAALLAGLVKSPAGLDPVSAPQAATRRRGVVLGRMVAAGYIDRATAERVDAMPLGLDLTPARNGCADSSTPFFCGYALAELRATDSLGDSPQQRARRLRTGGLTVRTTLQPSTQSAAEKGIAANIDQDNPIATAIVMTQPGDGAVRAIALNRDWGTGPGQTEVNYALDRDQGGSSGFQAGSTFKPFVLTAALGHGIKRSLELAAPSGITVDGFDNCATGRSFPPYTVENYGNHGYGTIDMPTATALSVNTYFVQLEERTGICAPPRIAERMGLSGATGEPLSRVPSFVLGVDEVSPLRMAEAYATFAAGGVHCDSYAITGITGPAGDQLDPPPTQCERAIPEPVADAVTDLLQGVISGDNSARTGADAAIGRPAAGKTGTTNDITSVWFNGFTRGLAAAVWAGFPEQSKPLRDVTVQGRRYQALFGGALPLPIWRDAMQTALAGEPKQKLD